MLSNVFHPSIAAGDCRCIDGPNWFWRGFFGLLERGFDCFGGVLRFDFDFLRGLGGELDGDGEGWRFLFFGRLGRFHFWRLRFRFWFARGEFDDVGAFGFGFALGGFYFDGIFDFGFFEHLEFEANDARAFGLRQHLRKNQITGAAAFFETDFAGFFFGADVDVVNCNDAILVDRFFEVGIFGGVRHPECRRMRAPGGFDELGEANLLWHVCYRRNGNCGVGPDEALSR